MTFETMVTATLMERERERVRLVAMHREREALSIPPSAPRQSASHLPTRRVWLGWPRLMPRWLPLAQSASHIEAV